MKILFLATYFPTPVSLSRGNWALEQAQAFKQAGHDVRVVVPTPWLPRWTSILGARFSRQIELADTWNVEGLDVEYWKWPYYPWHMIGKLNRMAPRLLLSGAQLFLNRPLKRCIETFSPDVVCAHHTMVAGQVAQSWFQKYGLPYVVTDHEVGDFIECQKRDRVKAVFERVAKDARCMVVVSASMQREAIKALPEAVFKVIHNGSSFSPVTNQELQQRTSHKEVTVFCCCKFYGRKDVPLLLQAIEQMAPNFPQLRLRIAGDGPDRTIIEKQVSEMSSQDRVSLLGLLSPDEVRTEMMAADVFALVGWAEPFGVVFLEAMACGLPVVVCEDAGVAEVLENGKNALFSKPRDLNSVIDALVPLIESQPLRLSLGESARDHFASEFRWQQVIAKYEDVMSSP
ncbi:MAG: glycosyltransferase [Verrucomicrobiae bacterium]|nr:glycosyltransferase [Verrucomicrobiae bacterium]NNJ44010.1 glycosyltransferase [Akkermansiaceae bacterium]